jgi:hypothetical protein
MKMLFKKMKSTHQFVLQKDLLRMRISSIYVRIVAQSLPNVKSKTKGEVVWNFIRMPMEGLLVKKFLRIIEKNKRSLDSFVTKVNPIFSYKGYIETQPI